MSTSDSSFFHSQDSDAYQSSFVSFDHHQSQSQYDHTDYTDYTEDSDSYSTVTELVHTSSFASSANTSFASSNTTSTSTSNTTSLPAQTPRTNAIRTHVDKLLGGAKLTPRGIIGLASGFAKPYDTETNNNIHIRNKNKLLADTVPISPNAPPASTSSSSPRTEALRLQVDQALNNKSSTPEKNNLSPANASTATTTTTSTFDPAPRPPPIAIPRTGLKGVIDRLLGITPAAVSTSNGNTNINTNTNASSHGDGNGNGTTTTLASAVRKGIRRLSTKKKKKNISIKSSVAGDEDTDINTITKGNAGSSSSKAVNVGESKGGSSSTAAKSQGDDEPGYAGSSSSSAAVKVNMNMNMNIGGSDAKKGDIAKGDAEDKDVADAITGITAITEGISGVKIGDEGETAAVATERVGTPVKSKLEAKKVEKKKKNNNNNKMSEGVDELTDALGRVKIVDEGSLTAMPVWLRGMKPKQLWRTSVAERLFFELDTQVFCGKLGKSVKVTWNALFRTTAGTCELIRKKKGGKTWRLANIKLSQKVLDEPERLYTTLAHEMAHAAAWVLDDTFKPPHGKMFRKYTKLFSQFDPSLNITTCHSYDIRYKYNYQCTWCKTTFGRHSTKIDITKKNCSCGGDLVLLDNNNNNKK